MNWFVYNLSAQRECPLEVFPTEKAAINAAKEKAMQIPSDIYLVLKGCKRVFCKTPVVVEELE